jgi:hypothetical protein
LEDFTNPRLGVTHDLAHGVCPEGGAQMRRALNLEYPLVRGTQTGG